MRAGRAPSEAVVVFLVGAVQFVNILDFVMVMPMGPDFALALGIPTARLGIVGGAYTASAAVAGLVGSAFLDRFDRRKVLGLAMLGLVIGTVAGGFAQGLASLVAARVVAGAFGGPATSAAFSIIADVVPPERRGKAMGAVMGAFSVASVLGVPAALELARQGGWRAPFFTVGALGFLLAAAAVSLLPPMTRHLAHGGGAGALGGLRALLGRGEVRASYLMTFVTMMAGFILIPNLSAYVQQNLGYPRERLGYLYMAGGVVSFVAMRVVGWLVDRYGSFRIGSIGTALLATVVYLGFVRQPVALPVMGLFIVFMLAMAFRNVSYNTLTSKVPRGPERARFMSLQSAVQHTASATGAFLSARLLVEVDGRLVGMDLAAWVTIGLTAVLPGLLWHVERLVKRRAAAGPTVDPALLSG